MNASTTMLLQNTFPLSFPLQNYENDSLAQRKILTIRLVPSRWNQTPRLTPRYLIEINSTISHIVFQAIKASRLFKRAFLTKSQECNEFPRCRIISHVQKQFKDTSSTCDIQLLGLIKIRIEPRIS